MKRKPDRPLRPLIAVLIAWGVLAVANTWWVSGNPLKLPPPWDAALQQLVGLRVWEAYEKAGLEAAWEEAHARSPFGPPLFPLSTIPLYALFGPTRNVAHFASSLYLLVHMLAVFYLGWRWRGAGCGLLAVFLFVTSGPAINLSRDYLHDFPAAAFVALSIGCLSASDGLRRPWAAAFAGIGAGLAALTKSMSLVFFVGPTLYLAAAGWRRRTPPRPAVLAGALLAGVTIAWPWWGRHGPAALGYLWHYGVGPGAAAFAPAGQTLLTLHNLFFYLLAFVNEVFGVPMALVAGVTILLACLRRERGETAGFTSGLPWAWLLGGYVALTLSLNKTSDRYVVFLLTPVVVLLAGGILRLGGARRVVLTAALLAGSWNYLAWTLGAAWWAPRVVYYRPPARLLTFQPRQQWLRWEPGVAAGHWPVEAAVAQIVDRAHEIKRAAGVAYIGRHAISASALDQVRAAFRALLQREPEPGALQAYARQLEAGRTAAGLLREIAASEEFERRPLRVGVVPDEPLVNAATLNYYAATRRARVNFVHQPRPGDGQLEIEAVVLLVEATAPPIGDGLGFVAAGYERVFSAACPDGRWLAVYAPARDRATPEAQAQRPAS